MKTIEERVKQEKKFWNELFKLLKRNGLNPKWETVSQFCSRQKVWSKIEQFHLPDSASAYYGLSCSMGRIGAHELRFCVEMQDDVKIGFRFLSGINYWSEEESNQWEDLSILLDASRNSWIFKKMGWFCYRKLPVSLDFTKDHNAAALDMYYYQQDSYAKALLFDELFTQIKEIRSSINRIINPQREKVWSLC